MSAPQDRFLVRPAAYGIVLHHQHVLLVRSRETYKWWFPGGGIERGEDAAAAVQREVQEETGIAVVVDTLFHSQDFSLYFDPLDAYWHCVQSYFLCTPQTTHIRAEIDLTCDEHEDAAWINLDTLDETQFQLPADHVFRLLIQTVRP